MLEITFSGDIDDKNELIAAGLERLFPGKDGREIYNVLLLYDKGFISARGYFAYYYVMGVGAIIDYVNSSGFGDAWEFMKNAVFDMGINVLCRFYGEDKGNSIRKEERILWKCYKIFGEDIFTNNGALEKKIIQYRHNHSAHFGNGYRNTSIKYDEPIHALEKLRLNRKKFDEEKMEAGSSIYMTTLDEYFCTKIKTVINMVGGRIKEEVVACSLREYINDVLKNENVLLR